MINVQNLIKDFTLSKKQRKEMGDDYKNTKILRAVDGITFDCKPGRIFGLLGPNGAGKTTALRMIATMLKPTSGSISVCGFDFNSFIEMDFIYLNLLTSMNNLCHIVKKVSGIIKE